MLLLDSSSRHCEKDVQNAKSLGKNIILKIITKGTTGRMMCMDSGCGRIILDVFLIPLKRRKEEHPWLGINKNVKAFCTICTKGFDNNLILQLNANDIK